MATQLLRSLKAGRSRQGDFVRLQLRGGSDGGSAGGGEIVIELHEGAGGLSAAVLAEDELEGRRLARAVQRELTRRGIVLADLTLAGVPLD